jgi:RIO-like serine/threonine protein kinase
MLCSVQVKELQHPDDVFDTILGLIVRLAEHGLIHCDFNEFNIMVFFFCHFKSVLISDSKSLSTHRIKILFSTCM